MRKLLPLVLTCAFQTLLFATEGSDEALLNLPPRTPWAGECREIIPLTGPKGPDWKATFTKQTKAGFTRMASTAKCYRWIDISVNYGDVPTMNKSYSSVKELLYELRDYVVEYQTELNGCYKIAFNNNDFHICADLIDIIKDHNNVVRQMILLCNKIDIYGDNPSFDAHIKDNFWILGDK